MTSNEFSTEAPTMPPLPRRRRRKQQATWAIVVAVLLLGTYFRTMSLFSWDEPSYRLHPDERFMTDVASLLRLPTSFGEYFDSERNPLNPRNHGKEFYVYGLLPQTLTRVAAVILTPNAALPPTTAADETPNSALIPNPELRVPKLAPLQALLNPSGRNLTDYNEIHKIGRAWSALFDIASLLLVFLIGRRLYGRKVGLLAMFLLAVSVLPIQLAHFFTVDATTAFFTLLTVYWAVRLAQDGAAAGYIPLGLSIGLAMSSRITMATLALLAILVAARRAWQRAYATDGTVARRPGGLAAALYRQLAWLALAGALAFLVFRVLQPDAFLGTSAATAPAGQPASALSRLFQGRGFFDIRPDPRFIENYRSISATFSGEMDWPPSQQWAGRTRYLFALENMVIWGMGLPLGLAAWAGWIWAGWQLFRRRQLKHLVPWAWIAFFFGWQGGQAFMTMRYYSMLYGLLAIFAAWLLLGLARRRNVQDAPFRLYITQRWTYQIGRAALVLVVIFSLCWAYAFTRIYTRAHTRVTASRWLYANVPPGSAITSESWDDGLPIDLDGYSHDRFVGIQTYPYAEDDQSKYTGARDANGTYNPGLFDQLDQADYIVLSSNRVYDSATRLPMRYPALTRYYHTLFNGELGFALVADFNSYPTLFGISIPDQSSEEAFTVYDHPRVLVFQKTPSYSRARAEQLIAGGIAWSEVYKMPTMRASRVPTALRLTDTQLEEYRSAGTWSALFNPAGLANQLPWLVWLLALEAIGLAMFALLFRLLPGLPDRGFALVKMLALLLVAYAAWLLGSARLLAFGPASVWLCAGLLIVIGGVVGWRARRELRAFLRNRRTALLTAEGLFLLAYFGFVLLRALNPDLWHPARGGEKPMDLAFLTAVVKSPYFPPYDPWFAGGYINYYYFGFVLVGTLVHLTGVVPTTAYNLAVPTLFALTALGAWGAAYNLIAPRATDDRQPATGDDRPAAGGLIDRRAIATGLAAAAFVVLLGPLAQAIWFLPGSAAADARPPAECQATSYAAQQSCQGRPEWAFWDATRLVGMDLRDSTINEFPFFTFLFADMHAHMIALPLALLALGLMVALARAESHNQSTRQPGRSIGSWLVVLGCLALVLGALRATNTWDFPTYLALSFVTMGLLAWRRLQHGASLPRTALAWVGASVGLLLGSTLLFQPFLRSFATDYAGFEIWRGSRTSAADFVRINGLWLFMLISGAVLLYWRRGARLPLLLIIGGGPLLLALATIALKTSAVLLLVPLGIAAVAILVDHLLDIPAARPTPAPAAPANTSPYVQLMLPLLDVPTPSQEAYVAPIEQDAPTHTPQLLAICWGLFALLIALATELVVAKGDIGRMNTVFKFGMQSWTLFGLASALALGAIWPLARQKPRAAAGWAWRAAAALLVAAALVYPLTATPARLADRIDDSIGPTLDGTAFMRSDKGSWAENNQQFDFVQDAAAISWMQANIAGSPIVLEAHTEAYRWGGRVSIYTGLPTLLGWPWHETQQRQVADVGPILAGRQDQIQRMYSGADPATTLRQLQTYGVEYVYVGKLERALYPAAGLAQFDTLAQSGQLERVYTEGQTQIYRVPRASTAPAVASTTLATRPPVLAASGNTSLNMPVYTLPVVGEYAWNGLAQSDGAALGLWLLAFYALLALGLPLAALIFGRLGTARAAAGDGGWSWARLVGLLLLGYAVWLPVSLGTWSYNRWGLLFGLLLVLALDAALLVWVGRRSRMEESEARADASAEPASAPGTYAALMRGLGLLRAHLGARRRAIVVSEVLFLGAFGFMAALRAFNPDLWQPFWGGEKPFEFGFLNAILRSPVMPPYDPFFSDGKINYYYYGLFLASLPIKATGINPAVGFNLVIATLFAFTLTGAVAIVTRLTGRLRYGLAGGAFVALLGNLAAAFPVGWGAGLAPAREALAGGLAGFGERMGSWFVGPSRVIVVPDKLMTINEFPFWSYLFADLHPHLIAMPLALLLIALAFELFDTEPRPRGADAPHSLGWLSIVRRSSIGLAALTLGAMAVTNSWDLPTYTLLIAGALAGRAWRGAPSGRRAIGRMGLAALEAGAIVFGALLLYLPFFQNYQRPAGVNGIGLVRDGSPLGGFALIYGLYLLILGVWVFGIAARLLQKLRRRAPHTVIGSETAAEQNALLGIVARPPGGKLWRGTSTALLVIGALIVAVALSSGAGGQVIWSSPLLLKAGLLLLLAAGVPALLARRLPQRAWFALWLAVLAWAVSLGVELIYIRDHLDGSDSYRMNTVFKFGLQAWMLMALAAAAALPWLGRGLRRAGAAAQTIVWALIIGLIGLALVFPLVGTPSRLAYRFPEAPGPTLDGLAFMRQAEFDLLPEYIGRQGVVRQISLNDDLEAIGWLNHNVRGTPIVLQSDLWFYRTYGVRVAANTGLPTVVSPLHASEQHNPAQVNDRDLDVQEIYNSPDPDTALRLLAKYHVGYVYIGQIERAAYDPAGIAKFEQMAGTFLKLAHQNPTVTIYKVDTTVYTRVIAGDIQPPPDQPVPPPDIPAEPPVAAPQPPIGDGASLETLEQQVRNSPTVAGSAFALAERYRALQRLDDAAAVLAIAAPANPNDVAIHHLWGDILRDANRFDEAEQAYRDAVTANPSAINYNKLGVELTKMGRLERAAEALNQALALDVNGPEPYFSLGQLYEQQGDPDKALESYRAYVALATSAAPHYAEASAAIARLQK